MLALGIYVYMIMYVCVYVCMDGCVFLIESGTHARMQIVGLRMGSIKFFLIPGLLK